MGAASKQCPGRRDPGRAGATPVALVSALLQSYFPLLTAVDCSYPKQEFAAGILGLVGVTCNASKENRCTAWQPWPRS